MNRVAELVPYMTKDPVANMRRLLGKLAPSTIVPEVDKYYVFIYQAKTPGVRYDQHPLIVCTTIWKWGFIGFNFHWNEYRRYSWAEVVSNLYEIYSDELNTVEKLPLAKFKNVN